MFPNWEPISFTDILKDEKSFEYKELKRKMRNRETSFEKLEKLAKILQKEGLELLEKCLCFDPNRRITAKMALSNDFFKDMKNLEFDNKNEHCLFPLQINNLQNQNSNLPLCYVENILKKMMEKDVLFFYLFFSYILFLKMKCKLLITNRNQYYQTKHSITVSQ